MAVCSSKDIYIFTYEYTDGTEMEQTRLNHKMIEAAKCKQQEQRAWHSVYRLGGSHSFLMNSLALSVLAFQLFPTNPLNLCAFLFLWARCQDIAQKFCRLYLWVHLSLLLRSICTEQPTAADSWSSQGTVRPSLSALIASFLLISLPEQESISFGIPSGSNGIVISNCHDS